MTNTKISEILKTKGPDVFTIDANATVLEAAGKMIEHNVGSLIVLKQKQVAGIVTERDCLRHLAAHDKSSEKTRVAEIMTSDVVVVQPTSTVEECMAIMTEKRCRHLPVCDDQGLVGLVSIGDLVKQAARDQKVEIRYLTEFIMGNYPGVEARGAAVFA